MGGVLTSVVVNTVGLDQSYGDGPARRVVVLLQLRLPQDGIPVLAEALLGPVASREFSGAILLAEHCHAVQAIVADVVAGDVGQAGRHHPHTAALIRCNSERRWSLMLPTGEAAPGISPGGEAERHWPGRLGHWLVNGLEHVTLGLGCCRLLLHTRGSNGQVHLTTAVPPWGVRVLWELPRPRFQMGNT